MDQAQAQQMAQQFIDALHTLESGSADDTADIVALFADDARLTNAALDGKELTGKDGVQKFWTDYRRSFGEIRSEFSHVIANEDAAGLFWRSEGSGKDGQAIGYDGVSLLVWSDDGKIGFFQGYYDTRKLGEEIGIDQRGTA
jgi:ketosteroid isomerase-like protein